MQVPCSEEAEWKNKAEAKWEEVLEFEIMDPRIMLTWKQLMDHAKGAEPRWKAPVSDCLPAVPAEVAIGKASEEQARKESAGPGNPPEDTMAAESAHQLDILALVTTGLYCKCGGPMIQHVNMKVKLRSNVQFVLEDIASFCDLPRDDLLLVWEGIILRNADALAPFILVSRVVRVVLRLSEEVVQCWGKGKGKGKVDQNQGRVPGQSCSCDCCPLRFEAAVDWERQNAELATWARDLEREARDDGYPQFHPEPGRSRSQRN